MKEKTVFLVLEGLSAVGKTTVGEILAEQMGATFYKTPSPLFGQMRELVDRHADLTARLLFYLAGVVQSSVEIGQILRAQSVVCDRYLDTTVCYHTAMGVSSAGVIGERLRREILRPDFTFLLTCEQRVRLKRLEGRGLSYNDLVEKESGVEELFLKEYKSKGLLEVDNTSTSPQETAERLYSIVTRGGR